MSHGISLEVSHDMYASLYGDRPASSPGPVAVVLRAVSPARLESFPPA